MVLYEDELDDNGISLLTAKVVCNRSCPLYDRRRVLELHGVCLFSFFGSDLVFLTECCGYLSQRVMPSCWFLLLRFWVSLILVVRSWRT